VGVVYLNGETEGLRFWFEGGQANYRTIDTTGTSDLGIPFTGDGMDLLFTQKTNGVFELSVGGNLARTSILSNSLLGIDHVRVFAVAAGPGPEEHDVYFNCVDVIR